MTSSLPKPKCLALILCDQVIEDKRTNNKTLVGLFNRIQATNLPAIHPKMCIVVSLCNGRGKVPIQVQINSLTTEELLFKAEGQVEFNDPLAVCDLIFDLRQVPFKQEGTHAVTVSAMGEQLLERRFIVQVVKGKQ